MIEVRRARAGEAEAIAQLHVASRRAAYAGIFVEPHSPERILADRRAMWERAIPPGNVWVAAQGERLLGVAQAGASRDADAAPGAAELYLLYVALGGWRTGVGTCLVNNVERQSVAAGFRTLTVWVLAENAVGCGFYRKRGFADDGCARDVNGRGLIEKRMVKPLQVS